MKLQSWNRVIDPEVYIALMGRAINVRGRKVSIALIGFTCSWDRLVNLAFNNTLRVVYDCRL